MGSVSNKVCRGIQNTYFVFSNFFSENRAFCEIMPKNTGKLERQHKTIWRRVLNWISKTTSEQTQAHTLTLPHIYALAQSRACSHTQQYVMPIVFPLQQWFRKPFLILRYTYIACLVLLLRLFLVGIVPKFLHLRLLDMCCINVAMDSTVYNTKIICNRLIAPPILKYGTDNLN